jgi:hypothetical protein
MARVRLSPPRQLIHLTGKSYGEVKNYLRFVGFTAVTMKNVVFWDIKTQFIPHRTHITSPLQS